MKQSTILILIAIVLLVVFFLSRRAAAVTAPPAGRRPSTTTLNPSGGVSVLQGLVEQAPKIIDSFANWFKSPITPGAGLVSASPTDPTGFDSEFLDQLPL